MNPEAAVDLRGFANTDLGNARRLVALYGDDLRYCSDWGRWLAWDAFRWAEDSQDNASVRGMAHALTEAMQADGVESLQKFGRASQESGKITAMIREAQVALNVRALDLDTQDHLLSTRSGVVDLRYGTKVDDALAKDSLITRRCDVEWDPEASCPVFERFLHQIMRGRKDLVDLLVRAIGYTLTGSVVEQKWFLLYGARGRNGKSTLLELLQGLLGDGLCGPINKALLVDSQRDSARFAMASIEGRRMVYANELPRGRSMDVEFVKEFAGGTTMQAERKGKDEHKFPVKAKLWYGVNAMPSAEWSSSYGDRVIPIPFEQSYYSQGSADWREGDLPPDRDLLVKMRAEAPGILAYLIREGSVRWYAEGLVIPKTVTDLIDAYREENDVIGQWLDQRCYMAPEERVTMSVAFADFLVFVKANHVPWTGSIREFRKGLETRAPLTLIKPKNVSTVLGMILRTEVDGGSDE